jgi:hypothetical protein
MTCASKILVIISGASFLVGSFLLAYSIKWQSDLISKDDNSEFAKKVRQMGSPGHTDPTQFKAGLILSCLGYILFILGTLI